MSKAMNRLTTEDRVRILAVLCEGVGINAACRDTGASKNTVLKLVADVGQACALYQDQVMRNVKITQLQVDETWSFIGEKAKNVPAYAEPTLARGDCYTFIALDPVTKLMPCWLVGFRGYGSTDAFIEDLASRLADSRQLLSDDFAASPAPDARDCGSNVNYGACGDCRPYKSEFRGSCTCLVCWAAWLARGGESASASRERVQLRVSFPQP